MKRITALEKKYVDEVLSNEFSLSKKSIFTTRLEKEFASIKGVKHAITHSNCTSAIHTALAACGVEPGDEVVLPALSMSSPAMAVLCNSSIPVFADVKPDTFTIDAGSVSKLITPKTKAVISVSLYGLPSDYDEIIPVCNKNNLFLIEDNAQCVKAKYKDKSSGDYGHFSVYSFGSSKQLTAGEGGILTTNDDELAGKAHRFHNLGFDTGMGSNISDSGTFKQSPQYFRHFSYGFNYRMPELCAAVALAQVQRMDELIDLRKKTAAFYDDAVKNSDMIYPQLVSVEKEHTYWTYAMVFKSNVPEMQWFQFRDAFIKNGGNGFYGAWQLAFNEPFFKEEVQHYKGVWQRYDNELCPVAGYLQPRIMQLKTNYMDISEAEKQAEILYKTLLQFA
ncbi:MAG: DegT/DnrJ/EryC1/StrS family aminotransferase [Bacteroidales bacterium]|jgi:perosamine synthetase|nr:DegT/DnrJ/EryC1/StrS family aminotransferase [Bacteroidales bacterium]MDD4215198.1 DegT/DnrJ/EryC1/StrS family aminotransferase [Bacteroidales bacterium]